MHLVAVGRDVFDLLGHVRFDRAGCRRMGLMVFPEAPRPRLSRVVGRRPKVDRSRGRNHTWRFWRTPMMTRRPTSYVVTRTSARDERA